MLFKKRGNLSWPIKFGSLKVNHLMVGIQPPLGITYKRRSRSPNKHLRWYWHGPDNIHVSGRETEQSGDVRLNLCSQFNGQTIGKSLLVRRSGGLDGFHRIDHLHD